MTSTIEKTETPSAPTVRERLVDAGAQAAHLSHEGRLLRSVAEDAMEAGVWRAKRAARRSARQLTDLRDEAAYRVKRQPLAAIGVAAGVGLFVGVVTGLVAGRLTTRRRLQ
jgi:ElaB/YqjD/DUF883 family membrane-anchored ribosome-binding protein